MTKVKFIPKEREWLVSMLSARALVYQKYQPKEKYLQYGIDAILKLDILNVNVTTWKKFMCLSVTNQKLSQVIPLVQITV